MSKRERIRNRLSSLEIVPDAALPDVQWAFDMVASNRMQQVDLIEQLNERLAKNEVGPVSRSGFNRWAQGVRAGHIRRPGGAATASAGGVLSATTRSLIASALRAIADDIEGPRS